MPYYLIHFSLNYAWKEVLTGFCEVVVTESLEFSGIVGFIAITKHRILILIL